MKNHVHYIKQWFLWKYQKLTRGYSDDELWNLDCTIAQFVLPRLKSLISIGLMGHPHTITEKQWELILKDIVYAMEISARGDWNLPTGYCEERHIKGLKLFGEYFIYLWD